jgi:sulfhydrogenase subunit beta (sulfur reductase)
MATHARILVIDDEFGIREGCRRALSPQGYAVDVAGDAAEGLAQLVAVGYDLALLDVMMPGMSGLELLGKIHEHDPKVVCIIITGYATVAMAVNAIKQGAYDFLTKPFGVDDLLLAVEHGLEHRWLIQEQQRLREVEAEAQQLATEKAKLEEIDKAKAAFIRLITHELQAPIAAVESYLRLILDGFVAPDDQRTMLERCQARALEQMALIADLLEFGRLRDGQKRGRISNVRLDTVLRHLKETLDNQASQQGVTLTVEIPTEVPPVRGVMAEFKSIWTNLIGNAIKYTPSGGAVTVILRADAQDGQVIGQVSDTGIGIPKEAQDKLFSEFYRADNAKAIAARGTGLGLAIVKRIIEGAGGQITVDSELGAGATFTFLLPTVDGTPTGVPGAQRKADGAQGHYLEQGGRMSLKMIEKGAMAGFVSGVMGQYAVIGPQVKDRQADGREQFAFGLLTDPDQLRLDYNTTILPPKKHLLPQEETLFTFRTADFSATPVLETRPQVILGVHTCDIHAMKLLDAVFATGEKDEHYLLRRNASLIIGIECLKPCDEHSFCKSMNTLTVSDGFDLHLTDLGDVYAVEVGTEAGAKLLAEYCQTCDASDDAVGRLNQALSEKWPRFSYRLDFDGAELPSLMALSYKDPLWDELGKRCLACGSCNIVCPTCYCFNVCDRISLDGQTGERVRLWDSCQLDEFARVATGENFRHKRSQRQRHRFFRKGKYIPDMHSELGCVGCGRCARACLVDITPVGVWNALYQAHAS